MEDNQRSEIIQTVRNLRDSIGTVRSEISLTVAERQVIDRLYSQLDKIEDVMIQEEIQKHIDKIKSVTYKLDTIVKKMDRDSKSLNELSKKVDNLARALKAIVATVATAIKIL